MHTCLSASNICAQLTRSPPPLSPRRPMHTLPRFLLASWVKQASPAGFSSALTITHITGQPILGTTVDESVQMVALGAGVLSGTIDVSFKATFPLVPGHTVC